MNIQEYQKVTSFKLGKFNYDVKYKILTTKNYEKTIVLIFRDNECCYGFCVSDYAELSELDNNFYIEKLYACN